MTTREYAYDLWYATDPSAPPRDIPTSCSRTFPTETARDTDMLAYSRMLEAQGYTVLKAERRETCARCHGGGSIKAQPKGWRKRTSAPWYMLRDVACPACRCRVQYAHGLVERYCSRDAGHQGPHA